MDAFRDGNFLIGCQRHSIFIDRECDHRRTKPLRHRQDFRGALLAILQIDRIDDRFARNAFERLFHHVGFGTIDQHRRRDASRDLFQNGCDVALLVLAHNGAAQVEHVRAFVDQLLRQREYVVVFLVPDEIAEVLDPRRRIQFLGHDQRLGIEIEWYGCIRA